MSTGEICVSLAVPEKPPSSSETQDEKLPNSWMQLKDILRQDEKSPTIHKVPHRLRQVNGKAYDPNIISIGPYHHGKQRLMEMEYIKKSFFIKTVGESSQDVEKLNKPAKKAGEAKPFDKSEKELEDLEVKVREKKKIKAIKDLEEAIRREKEKIRECYAESFNDIFNFESKESEQKFIEMVVFDGFFIVQLFRGIYPMEDLFRRQSMIDEIIYDLLLLENQLPFFVLLKLHQIITQNEETEEAFIERIVALLGAVRMSECPIAVGKDNIQHLLHLIHATWSRPDQKKSQSNSKDEWEWKWKSKANVIRCARELEEAGISFERKDENGDIEFRSNGRKSKLQIPHLSVDHHTERYLRNFIAFEQFFPFEKPTYVRDYVRFIDQLIDSEQDVQLLCNSDIIENNLGDYKTVAKVFNRLGDYAYGSSKFYYSETFERINGHCDSSYMKRMAYMQRNYFNSPCALLSILGALLLLLLTITQTMFTLLTIDCLSCLVLFVAFGILLVVIGIFCYMCFG